MLKKYIMLFVLVMLVVKTNAQSGAYYYYGDRRVDLQESDDQLLIRVYNTEDYNAISNLYELVNQDANFQLQLVLGDYWLLGKVDGSNIQKADAIEYYMNLDGVSSAKFVFENENGTIQCPSDEIHLKVKNGISQQELVNMLSTYEILSIRSNQYMTDVYSVRFSKSAAINLFSVANSLYETGDFYYVEPNFFRSVKKNSLSSSTCSAPSLTDPNFANQWSFYNSSATTSTNTQWEDIAVCKAWNLADYDGGNNTVTGSSIKVAIIDDGVDWLHPDLDNNIPGSGSMSILGYNAIPPSCAVSAPPCNPNPVWPIAARFSGVPGSPSFTNSHGTWCAGIIAAEQNNGIGISGIAYQAQIIPVRIFYDHAFSCSFYTTDAWSEDGINWAVNNGADVLNCSWGGGLYASIIDNAITNAVTNGRPVSPTVKRGCVVVFSSGNDNNTALNWPASHPDVIAVGASSACAERKRDVLDPDGVSCDGQTTWGSNYGTGVNYGGMGPETGYLSVVAPGTSIFTTSSLDNAVIGCGVTHSGQYYGGFSGTSAAAPHVAGIAALMLSANPCLTWEEVRHIIRQTADKIPGPAVNPYAWTSTLFPGDPDGNWETQVGYGRANAGNAVTWAHDMYRQNESTSSTQVYTAAHKIFAGENVDITGLKATGSYTVNSGADILFRAPDGITLAEGFEALAGATFTASIVSPQPCVNSEPHYKPGKEPSAVEKFVTPRHSGKNEDVSQISIFPNPVQNDLKISFILNVNSGVELTVYNIVGQVMLKTNDMLLNKGAHTETLATSNLTPGVYTISIKTNSGINTFRFVKE